ncbi:hypothetical protein GPL21_40875 [Bradyrhizobium pachyrhizi]|uniref:Uncharacterized protein n=1 Tax=Bradyrhizobium pachyrhizi TaxID=280333 RepID=A0A844SWH6_9BRAD|nr:hypothetical protein [Bradyrhizobium pachyrhizi]MVT71343.1 hypothetical protein [Bradyrhizobium pachyrhizi]
MTISKLGRIGKKAISAAFGGQSGRSIGTRIVDRISQAAGSVAAMRKARCSPDSAGARDSRQVVINARIVLIKAGNTGAIPAHPHRVPRAGIKRAGRAQ